MKLPKSIAKPVDELRAVYLRMQPELVKWLDQEAKRQRRSRAYVVSQAVRMMRAFIEQIDRERLGE